MEHGRPHKAVTFTHVRLAERLTAERSAELRARQRENEQLKSERAHYWERWFWKGRKSNWLTSN